MVKLELPIFIVVQLSHDGYDSWDVSYHLTKKGAWRAIIEMNYQNWLNCRYVRPGSWDDLHLYIREGVISE